MANSFVRVLNIESGRGKIAMKVGFFVAVLRMRSLDEIAKWAGENGFDALELWTIAKEGEGTISESFVNLAGFGKGQAEEVKGLMAENNLEISCVGFNRNFLSPKKGKANLAYLRKVVEASELLGVDTVSIFVGRDYEKNMEENVKLFAEVFDEPLRHAKDHGVRLAIENCPLFWEHQGLIGNMGFSPFYWGKLFDATPHENIGLNFDPSHLYWMQIDYVKAIKDFGDRIFHFHAKDTEVDQERLAVEGNLPFWAMVWRYRLPGWGEMSWPKIMTALHEVGYEGAISIEHEDMVFGRGDAETVQRGLMLGKKFLRTLEF